MVKTAIFDFDGTLASTLEGIYLCMRESLVAFGFPGPSLAEVRSTVGLTLEESVRTLTHLECGDSTILALVDAYGNLHRSKALPLTSLFAGTLETLETLRSLNIQSIVISNRSRSGLRRLTEHLMIKDYFDLMWGLEDVRYRKPDARLYTELIAPALSSPAAGETLVVGDTELDLLFARNAGLKSCWAAYGYGDPEKCLALKPDFVIAEIKELPSVLQGRNSS